MLPTQSGTCNPLPVCLHTGTHQFESTAQTASPKCRRSGTWNRRRPYSLSSTLPCTGRQCWFGRMRCQMARWSAGALTGAGFAGTTGLLRAWIEWGRSGQKPLHCPPRGNTQQAPGWRARPAGGGRGRADAVGNAGNRLQLAPALTRRGRHRRRRRRWRARAHAIGSDDREGVSDAVREPLNEAGRGRAGCVVPAGAAGCCVTGYGGAAVAVRHTPRHGRLAVASRGPDILGGAGHRGLLVRAQIASF